MIARLKVDSAEYDAKIQRAAKGLLHMEEACRKVGGTLAVLEDDEKKFVQSLGSMQTVATTVRGKLNELTQAYTELSVQYKRLTEEEKKGDFGKALSASLAQLKTRINDTKSELNDVSVELGNTKQAAGGTGSIVDELASKFGVSASALLKVGSAAGAAKIAFDVLKDAFFQSESNIDEWGRTMQSAEGAYDVFLNTINSGNWSNFFSNLSTAVQGARDLYDALDRLGSVKANNQAAIAVQQQLLQRLKLRKQNGEDVDDQIKDVTNRIARLQKQIVDAGKTAGTKMSFETLRNEVNASNKTGVNISDDRLRFVVAAMQRGGQDVFDQYAREFNQLKDKAQDTRTKSFTGSGGMSYTTDEQFTNLNKLTEEEKRRFLIAQAVTKAETRIQEGLNVYAQAVSEGAANAKEEFKNNRYALTGSGSGKGKSPQEQAQNTVNDALLSYSQAVDKAQMEFEAGTISELDVKKKNLQAQEQLWSAYGKAYATFSDPKYKEAQNECATKIKELGGEVKTATEDQKKQTEATRQLEAAQRKQAQEAEKQANLIAAGNNAAAKNDLKGFYAANKGLSGMGANQMEVPVGFTFTQGNLDAFKAHLKEEIANADFGTDLYNSLTGRLTDATLLGEFLQTAIKNGIDAAELSEFSSDIWKKIFDEKADIPDEVWQKLASKLSSSTGRNITANTTQGTVTDKEGNKFWDDVKQTISKSTTAIQGLSQINSGLKGLGVNLGSGVDKLLTTASSFIQVLQGLQTFMSVFQSSALAHNTAAIIANTTAMGVSNATGAATGTMAGVGIGAGAGGALAGALGPVAIGAAALFAGGKIFGLFANGGMVPHAESGYYVPGNHLSGDKTPIMANAGELILNTASQNRLSSDILQAKSLINSISGLVDFRNQILSIDAQSMLASDLKSGGMQSIKLSARIEGEDIVLVSSNYEDRWSGGESVVSH